MTLGREFIMKQSCYVILCSNNTMLIIITHNEDASEWASEKAGSDSTGHDDNEQESGEKSTTNNDWEAVETRVSFGDDLLSDALVARIRCVLSMYFLFTELHRCNSEPRHRSRNKWEKCWCCALNVECLICFRTESDELILSSSVTTSVLKTSHLNVWKINSIDYLSIINVKTCKGGANGIYAVITVELYLYDYGWREQSLVTHVLMRDTLSFDTMLTVMIYYESRDTDPDTLCSDHDIRIF